MLKIINDFKRKIEFKKLVKESMFDVKNNDFYKQNLPFINKCFADRKPTTPNDSTLNRIMLSYNLSKQHQINFPVEYQVGNEWSPIYKKYMAGIMDAMKTNNAIEVKRIYENFMRDSCSVGLHGLPIDMKKNFFRKNISLHNKEVYFFDCVFMFLCWKKLLNNKNFKNEELKMPDFGNAYGFFLKDEFIRVGAVYFHYYATKITEMLNSSENKTVVEIGGGYGGLAYFLHKANQNLTYVNFDLPENMALSSYYLMCCYPNKKFLLYGEEDIAKVDLNLYDFIIMPNFEITKLKENAANLVFNSYSLAEMSKETIDLYIKEMMKISNKYIMHVNHTKDSVTHNADNFGIDTNLFELLSKEKALWAYGRNRKADEFEYIYKKNI